VALAIMHHLFQCGSIGLCGLKNTLAALLLEESGRPFDENDQCKGENQ
jgi:hypothetical protein